MKWPGLLVSDTVFQATDRQALGPKGNKKLTSHVHPRPLASKISFIHVHSMSDQVKSHDLPLLWVKTFTYFQIENQYCLFIFEASEEVFFSERNFG